MLPTKICKKCHQEKDISLFRPKRNSCRACDAAYTMEYDRLHDTEERRARKYAYHKKYYAEHRNELIAQSKAWVDAHPEQARKTHQEYYLANKDDWNTYNKENKVRINARRRERMALPENKARKLEQDRAYRATHTESVKARQRAYTQEHIETIKARVKAWNKAHPEQRRNHDVLRKARKQGATATLSAAQWREIKEAFDHRCAYCGRKMQRLTQDHITPLIDNGDHHLHNVVPACQSCNSRKGTGKPLVPVQPLLLSIAPEHKKRKIS